MTVILIMLCAIVGTIAMLALCGCARWCFIYLIRYRILKMEVKQERYALTGKHDILAVIIAILTLAVTAVLMIYGVPFVAEHISELPEPFGLPLN